ncbi:hypothetical protein IW138_004423 [Coemansia sp. RSA 986]|nr:hypothetical protein IW138_004423 [Coemansia sp. RSA 986]
MATSANCGTIFKRIVKAVYLLYSLLTVASFLVGYILIYRYLEAPPATLNRQSPPPESKDPTLYRLSWQETKAEYEAKVYASQIELVNKNNAEQFFKTAQELWHIEPHTLDDRYPTYKTRVKVDVPQDALEKQTNALYAHIFIQKKGGFAPYPNVTDPFMVHAYTKLVKWKPIHPTPIDSAISFIKFESNIAVDYELVATKGVSWAMVLENHAFTKKELPFGIIIPNSPSKNKEGKTAYTYNPPLLSNMFTKNRWPENKLSLQTARTIDVALELQGIKLRWIKPKMLALLMMPAANNLTMTPITVPVADPKHPDREKKMTVFKPVLYIGNESLVDFVGSRGIHVYLRAALILTMMYLVQLSILYIGMCFLMAPKRRWVGFSRTAFVICITIYGLSIPTVAASVGIISAVLNPLNALIACLVLVMLDIPRDPRKWSEYWKNRHVLQNQQPPAGYQLLEDTELDEAPLSASSTSTERNRRMSASNDDEFELGDEGAATSTTASLQVPVKVDPHEHITNIRKSIDQVAMRWFVLSVGPILVLSSLLTLFSSKPMSLGSVLAFVVQLCVVVSNVYGAVWLVPQILVNRRAQSGSLLPPAFHICSVINGVLIVALMCTLHLSSVLVSPLKLFYWVAWVCNLIAVGQWIKYRRLSQQLE